MFNLFNSAINAVKNLISGKAASAPKPQANVITVKTPKPVSELPKYTPPPAFNPYIAQWGDSSAKIAAGQAYNQKQFQATADWASAQEAERKRAEQERLAREAREKMQKQIDETAAEYRKSAKNSIDNYRKNQDGNFWSWLTGGFVGDNETRKFAQQQAEALNKNADDYDKKLNSFLSEQQTRFNELQKKASDPNQDPEEYNKLLKIFTDWESGKIDDLNYSYAANSGLYSVYSKEAQKQGNSGIAQMGQLFGAAGNAVSQSWLGKIFQYTLGSGDENVPSLVTAPSRFFNWIGNSTFNAGGEKNLEDNKKVMGFEDGKNSWTQTYNQRNWNMPYAEKRTEDGFKKWYKERDLSQWQADIDSGKIKKSDVDKMFRDMYFSSEKQDQGWFDFLEFGLDPVIGLGKAGKATKWIGKATADAAKTTKFGARAGELFSTAKNKVLDSKPVKWLGAEYKNRDQKYIDAVKKADEVTDATRSKYLEKIATREKALAKARDEDFDDSILREFKQLADSGDDQAAKWLQQMKNGEFSMTAKIKNWTRVGGVGSNPRLQKLQDLADRWSTFADRMKLSDEITDSATRFGKGKKRSFYSPRTAYIDDLDNYDFRAKKKNLAPQSASELHRGMTDRYIMSNVKSDWRGANTKYMDRLEKELFDLKKGYRSEVGSAYAEARRLDSKRGTLSRYISDRKTRKNINSGKYESRTGLGRSVWNSTKDFATLPMSVWKKSVLKYRPAWTVNNIAYNIPASVLSGGAGALSESAKLLRPKNWKQALKEVPDSVKADLTGEFGRGYLGKNPLKKFDSKLTKGYSNIENWSRVAAFRAAKQSGLTDEQALKRVNKYLYDYKTRNWEVPLKQVIPFWGWSKNLSRAAVQMPFDRPIGAKAFHEIDQYQEDQFDRDFQEKVPELLELGYTEEQIESIKKEQSKYFKGKLKIGDSYISTPFNAFSDRGLSGVGVNPYLAALYESSASVDSFGNPVSGKDSTFTRRLISKFPQAELGKKAYDSWLVNSGKEKPSYKYIGERGSEGYGLTKEKQGYDSSKSNYVQSMDPRAKLGQDALAFLGVPRSMEFNKDELVNNLRLQKVTDEYFKLNTKGMEFDVAEKARQDLFKKYNITSDDFYKGVLAKYDSDNTKRIKDLKEEAATKNKLLFDEYGAQPQGTRNQFAVNKIRELAEQGYFATNPFLKSFSWITPESAQRAEKQTLVQDALASGNWSKYTAKYGKTEKAKARDRAVATGDWSEYASKYGTSRKSTPYQYEGKYFKSAESMARYKEGKFWESYSLSSKEQRKQLLADNPEFNRRANWTDDQWNEWREDKKQKERESLMGWGDFAKNQGALLSKNKRLASAYLTKRNSSKWLKVKFN